LTLPTANVSFGSNRGYSGGISLNREGKDRQPEDAAAPAFANRAMLDSRRFGLTRRDFLVRFSQGVSATFIPAGLRNFALASAGYPQSALSSGTAFHLHPHYRTQMPLDTVLLKTKSGLDNFITEKYADQIAAILAEWTSGLLKSAQQITFIEKTLAPGFSGSPLSPVESRLLRAGATLEIRRNKFADSPAIARDAFLRELAASVNSFSQVITAEFQITSIEASPQSPPTGLPVRLEMRVRYDLVGSGTDSYREQRTGYWDLEWESSPSSPERPFHLLSWRALDETRARCANPVYLDIAAQALASNVSYSSQLLRGTDYWRTVLDAASGIDIYGHNGVSVADIDNDGFDDLYICQPAGLPNRLFRNRGDGTFEDITESSGVGVVDNTACALFADFSNRGHQDLIVVRTSGPLLFVNEGNGKFRLQPDAFDFAQPPQGTFTGAAVADYDRDGWLDIYFCLYTYYQGTDQYKYPSPYYDAENGPPNFLMRNHRDGTFRDATTASGLNQNNTRYSFCCGWGDFNHDGWPDLYVVNDFGRKNLYRNNGDGTFTDIAPQAGLEDIGAGMGVCWLDYDNDGREDLYVADMWTAAGERITTQENFQKGAPADIRALYRKHAMGNSLFRSLGDSTFRDTSSSSGAQMARWAWSSDAWDFDHDGFPDLYIANGMVSGPSREDLNSFFWRQVVAYSPTDAKPSHDYEQGWTAINELIRSDGTWSGYERNVFYANNRDGTFSDVSGAVGLDFLEDGRSFALADFDHDGRQEVFLKNRNGPQMRVLKNVMKDLPPSIAFRLRGVKSNRDAIGAVVTIETETGRQTRSLQAGSGFLSQHSKEVFFGLGEAKGAVHASIRWPSGLLQELYDLPINHRLWVEEGSPLSKIEPFKKPSFMGNQLSAFARPQNSEALPTAVETWLLAPIAAPDFSLPDVAGQTHTLSAFRGRPLLTHFWTTASPTSSRDLKLLNQFHTSASPALHLLAVNLDDPADPERPRALARDLHLSFPLLIGSDDVAGIYNILYRELFDRHRDLTLPTSFLIDAQGDIVKLYQGPIGTDQIGHDFRHIPKTTAERLAVALPFPGVTGNAEFQRNYLSSGSIYFQRGYYDQAEASFHLALRDDPQSAEAHYGLGSVYLRQQKPADARDAFERAVKLPASYPGTSPNAWNNLGLIATQQGRTAEAIPYFQEALKLSPDHLIALENLGNAFRAQKRWDEARQTLERAVQVGPDDPEVNYSLGMVYAQIDQSDRANEYLQKALQLRPGYPEALNNLGVLYLRTQRRDQAVASFEECIRVAPAFDQSYLNLARVYAIEGDSAKTRAVLQDLLKQHPDHPQAKNMLEQLGR
jgi:tetratricopeptide (TPR) repeat protein/peroxiredoxin